jgi:hypothetical protein
MQKNIANVKMIDLIVKCVFLVKGFFVLVNQDYVF